MVQVSAGDGPCFGVGAEALYDFKKEGQPRRSVTAQVAPTTHGSADRLASGRRSHAVLTWSQQFHLGRATGGVYSYSGRGCRGVQQLLSRRLSSHEQLLVEHFLDDVCVTGLDRPRSSRRAKHITSSSRPAARASPANV